MEVYLKDKLMFMADGKEDCYKNLDTILQSFIQRNVQGCHTLSPKVDFTLHHDGYATYYNYTTCINQNLYLIYFI